MIELSGDDAKEGDIMEAFKLASKEINKILDFRKSSKKKLAAKNQISI